MQSRSPNSGCSIKSGDGSNNNDSPSRYSRASNDGNSMKQNKTPSSNGHRGDSRSGRDISSPRSEYTTDRELNDRSGYPSPPVLKNQRSSDDGRNRRYDDDYDRRRSGYYHTTTDKGDRSRSRSRHRRSDDNIHRHSDHLRYSGSKEGWSGSSSRPRLEEAGRKSDNYSTNRGKLVRSRSRSRSRSRDKNNFDAGGNRDSRMRRGEDWRNNKRDMASSSTPKSCIGIYKNETVEKSSGKISDNIIEREKELRYPPQQAFGQQLINNSPRPTSTNDATQTAAGNDTLFSAVKNNVLRLKSKNSWNELLESWNIELDSELVRIDNVKPSARRPIFQATADISTIDYLSYYVRKTLALHGIKQNENENKLKSTLIAEFPRDSLGINIEAIHNITEPSLSARSPLNSNSKIADNSIIVIRNAIGDWRCPVSGCRNNDPSELTWNFASRFKCNSCSTPLPLAARKIPPRQPSVSETPSEAHRFVASSETSEINNTTINIAHSMTPITPLPSVALHKMNRWDQKGPISHHSTTPVASSLAALSHVNRELSSTENFHRNQPAYQIPVNVNQQPLSEAPKSRISLPPNHAGSTAPLLPLEEELEEGEER